MASRVLVTGAGGFIGGYLAKALLDLGYEVRCADIKRYGKWWQSWDTDNRIGDLRDPGLCCLLMRDVDMVFHLASDMGGIDYISRHDFSCASSAAMTVNLLRAATYAQVSTFVFASSACIYPRSLQGLDAEPLVESRVQPVDPEGGYGWEKLFSEHLCSYAAGLIPNIRVARLFNVYGPYGAWNDGREKAPAALCRKVALASLQGRTDICVNGDGTQTRSFLYIDDCVSGLLSLARSGYDAPVNLASLELVSIEELALLVGSVAGIRVDLSFDLTAPCGVQSRVPDTERALGELGWRAATSLEHGIRLTYKWINEQLLRELDSDPAGSAVIFAESE
ncbi:NAD-dependent epimerase/dehydratase family protein [Streptomyces sp. NPDC059010]|uniref:NAD-dependent epimerase/dehydratase family protein n=1 Tax=Streptomyces sp. NPDC059010 TaxID=3346695 RepID=UPI0036821FCA